jgi:hypothetical protein
LPSRLQKAELFLEKRLPVLLAVTVTVCWKFYGDQWAQLIVAKNDIIYQTLVMFATIIVALLATYKVIIITADKNEGVSLLKSNKGMFDRFVDYIFWCICAHVIFSGYAFVYLLRDLKLSTDWSSTSFMFFASFSVFSLLRILLLFRIIIRRGA